MDNGIETLVVRAHAYVHLLDCEIALKQIAESTAKEIPGYYQAKRISDAEAWYHCYMWARAKAQSAFRQSHNASHDIRNETT